MTDSERKRVLERVFHWWDKLDGPGRDAFLKLASKATKERSRTEEKPTSKHPVPDDFKDLPLYAQDPKLCAKWDVLKTAWEAAYPGLDILGEVKKAHAWELAKRPKKNRSAFLQNWLTRAWDRYSRRRGTPDYINLPKSNELPW